MASFHRAPFLGQGANQALQDAYVLANAIQSHNRNLVLGIDGKNPHNLIQLCKEYENIRKPPTALLTLKSGFLGVLETLGGPFSTLFRDNVFRFLAFSGIAKKVYLDSAKPKL